MAAFVPGRGRGEREARLGSDIFVAERATMVVVSCGLEVEPCARSSLSSQMAVGRLKHTAMPRRRPSSLNSYPVASRVSSVKNCACPKEMGVADVTGTVMPCTVGVAPSASDPRDCVLDAHRARKSVGRFRPTYFSP